MQAKIGTEIYTEADLASSLQKTITEVVSLNLSAVTFRTAIGEFITALKDVPAKTEIELEAVGREFSGTVQDIRNIWKLVEHYGEEKHWSISTPARGGSGKRTPAEETKMTSFGKKSAKSTDEPK